MHKINALRQDHQGALACIKSRRILTHGIRNRPGSPSFFGNLLRMTAEQFSFNGVLAISLNFSVVAGGLRFLESEANFGISTRAYHKAKFKLKSLKIFVEFSHLVVSFFHDVFIISSEGNRIDAFWLGIEALTGACPVQIIHDGDNRTTRIGNSFVLPLL
ncbi:hypothetical protein Tco_1555236 [Tanacetum coccineum]